MRGRYNLHSYPLHCKGNNNKTSLSVIHSDSVLLIAFPLLFIYEQIAAILLCFLYKTLNFPDNEIYTFGVFLMFSLLVQLAMVTSMRANLVPSDKLSACEEMSLQLFMTVLKALIV